MHLCVEKKSPPSKWGRWRYRKEIWDFECDIITWFQNLVGSEFESIASSRLTSTGDGTRDLCLHYINEKTTYLCVIADQWPQCNHPMTASSSMVWRSHLSKSSSCLKLVSWTWEWIHQRSTFGIERAPALRYSWRICSHVWHYQRNTDQNLRNVFDTLLNLCCDHFRHFWRQKGGGEPNEVAGVYYILMESYIRYRIIKP